MCDVRVVCMSVGYVYVYVCLCVFVYDYVIDRKNHMSTAC